MTQIEAGDVVKLHNGRRYLVTVGNGEYEAPGLNVFSGKRFRKGQTNQVEHTLCAYHVVSVVKDQGRIPIVREQLPKPTRLRLLNLKFNIESFSNPADLPVDLVAACKALSETGNHLVPQHPGYVVQSLEQKGERTLFFSLYGKSFLGGGTVYKDCVRWIPNRKVPNWIEEFVQCLGWAWIERQYAAEATNLTP